MRELEKLIYPVNGASIRGFEHDGEYWFALGDVCRLAGQRAEYIKTHNLHVGDWSRIPYQAEDGHVAEIEVVTKSGAYKVLCLAPKILNWLATEVIPSLEKTGTYTLSGHHSTDIASVTQGADQLEWVRLQAEQMIALVDQMKRDRELALLADETANRADQKAEYAGREANRANQRLDDLTRDWGPIADYYDDNYPHDDPETWLTILEIEQGMRLHESPRHTAHRVLGGVASAIAAGMTLDGRSLIAVCRERQVRRGGFMSNQYPPEVCARACHQRIGC